MAASYVPGIAGLSRRGSTFAPALSASINSEAGDGAATPRAKGYITGFRDTVIKHLQEDEDEDEEGLETQDLLGSSQRLPKQVQEKNKLIIILVGLPGRGKTFVANKLMRYLNWLGHRAKHFNVGAYRRQIKDGDDVQDAKFFSPDNQDGMRARQQALDLALDDLANWLTKGEDNQVAVFDATNSTEERRQYLRSKFHGKFQYMFIESICNDTETLDKNYRLKMKYSPDYQGVDTEKALQDFKERVEQYEKVYEPLTDGTSNRHVHFIQLVDMVTGRGHMDINRISGYIPGKIVFFLMQVCKSGLTAGRKIWLSRHGESQFNSLGKIGGDAGLTPQGQAYAERLPDALMPRLPEDCVNEEGLVSVSVWTSTLTRTIQTAASLPFPKLRWKALDEIHAGVCDGMTYEQIKESMPEVHAGRKLDKLRFRYPSGESYLDIIQRLEPVVIEAEREKESVVIIGHQAILRVLYGYFMNIDIEAIPELSIPLHTLIELEPRPDGTMIERRFKVNINSMTSDPQELFSEFVKNTSLSPGSVHGDIAPQLHVETKTKLAHIVPKERGARGKIPAEPSGMTSPLKHHVNMGEVSSPLKRLIKTGMFDDSHGGQKMVHMASCASPEDLAPLLYQVATSVDSFSSCASPEDLAPALYHGHLTKESKASSNPMVSDTLQSCFDRGPANV